MLRIGVSMSTFSPRSSAGCASSMSRLSSAFSRPWSCVSQWNRATSAGTLGMAKILEKSRPFAFQCFHDARNDSRIFQQAGKLKRHKVVVQPLDVGLARKITMDPRPFVPDSRDGQNFTDGVLLG